MTFATEAAKTDSERFCLVKISPRKLLTDGTSLGGDDYEFDIGEGLLISSIRVFPADTAVTYTYVGGILTATSTEDLLTETVILYHDLFITGTTTRYTDGISGVDDAEWLPLLQRYPSASQTMRNIADGVFTLSDTSISMISSDRMMQAYLGENDSFSLAPLKIWVCINESSINKVIYNGSVSSASLSAGVITFQILDTFQKLNDIGTFGTNANSFITNGSALATYPEVSNAPAPITLGRSSPFKVAPTSQPFCTNTAVAQMYHLDVEKNLIKHTPLSIQPSTTSASFFVGRFVGTDIKKMTFGTVTRCYREVKIDPNIATANGAKACTFYFYVQCTNFSGEVGDCISYGNAPFTRGFNSADIFSEGLTVAWVCRTTPCVGPDGQTYQFVASWSEEFITGANPRLDSHGTAITSGVQTNPTLPDNYYYSYGVHRVTNSLNFEIGAATIATSTDYKYYLTTNLANGNEHVTPSVVSLGTYGGQTISALYLTINYANLRAQYRDYKQFSCRFSPNTALTHAAAMKFIVKSAGLTTLDSTFTQADSDLSASVSMTFPLSGAFTSYLQEAQYLAKSTFSVLRLNEDREVEYEVISNPTAAAIDSTKDSSNILVDSFSSQIQYQDIKSTINFTNPQLVEELSVISQGPASKVTSLSAQYLHGVTKEETYEHGLISIANRSAAISGYLASPTVEYTSTTASDDLITQIGDVVSITNDSVMGATTSAKAFVTEINTGSSKSTIKLNEVRGVP